MVVASHERLIDGNLGAGTPVLEHLDGVSISL